MNNKKVIIATACLSILLFGCGKPHSSASIIPQQSIDSNSNNTTVTQDVVYFGQITGKVVDEVGQPIESALIQVNPPVTNLTYTDADGNFILEGIIPGEYTINISSGGYEIGKIQLKINEKNKKINLDKPIILKSK